MGLIVPYKGKRPKIDPTVFVAPTGCVAGDVTIGKDSSVWFNTVVRGDFQPIQIGRCTNIQDNAVVHVMGDCPLTIGSHVIIGHNAIVEAERQRTEEAIRALRDDEIEALKQSAIAHAELAKRYKAELL